MPVVKDAVKDTTLEAIESVIRSHTCHSDGEDAVAKMPAPSVPMSKPKQGLSIEHVYGGLELGSFDLAVQGV